MSATDLFETSVLKIAFTDVADANWTALMAATSWWISAHTTDPGETGDQTIGEAAYTDYERVELARDTTDLTVSNDTVENLVAVAFPVCSGSPGDPIRYLGFGLDQTGAGAMQFVYELLEPFEMSVSAQPYFDVGELLGLCD